MTSSYSIIGLMSGTSMDGLDIAHCSFTKENSGSWKHVVYQTETLEFPNDLAKKIGTAIELSPRELLVLDKEIGQFFAEAVNTFTQKHSIKKDSIDAIASHGQTIFHQPEKGFTLQIGCGDTIAFRTGIPVINDFRQKDVIAGGQGAPLVPIGDVLLFSNQADAFLNIGGISNVCVPGNPTVAFDICPGNLPLNRIVRRLELPYDNNGENARKGAIDNTVLESLNALEFYRQHGPKSLGVEWLNEAFYPLIDRITNECDALATVVEHIAQQIGAQLNQQHVNSVMITGGGAKNQFLIERISAHFSGEIILPSLQLIDFKEAIIFGFLGALYLAKQPNALASVTGASHDTIGGVYHLP